MPEHRRAPGAAQAVRRGRRLRAPMRTRLARQSQKPAHFRLFLLRDSSNEPPRPFPAKAITSQRRGDIVSDQTLPPYYDFLLRFLAEPPKPALGFLAHIFRRRAAIDCAAPDRIGDGKDIKYRLGDPRLDRLHRFERHLVEGDALFG